MSRTIYKVTKNSSSKDTYSYINNIVTKLCNCYTKQIEQKHKNLKVALLIK